MDLRKTVVPGNRIIPLQRVMALTCALVMIALSLAACVGTGENAEYDILYKGLQEAEVNFCFPGNGHPDMKEVIWKLEKQAVRLKLKLNFSFYDWPEYETKIDSIIAAGSPCDAFYYSDSIWRNSTENWLSERVANKSVMDITQMFPTYAPNYYRKFTEEELKGASIDGRLYAIANRSPNTYKRSALVRSDLIERYNITSIKDYDELEAYLDTICKNEPDLFPLSSWDLSIGLFAEYCGYVIFDYQLGLVYKWDDSEMRLIPWEQTPEYVQSMVRYYNWYKNGYMKGTMGLMRADDTLITSGKWSCILTYFGASQDYNARLRAKGITEWYYVEFPLFPDKLSARTSQLDRAIAFSANANNAERAIMFIDFVQSSQENYDLFMLGIKDRHYVLKGERVSIPEGVEIDNSFIGWSGSWAFENIDFLRVGVHGFLQSNKEYRDIIDKTTMHVPHMGFRPDYSRVVSETVRRRTSFYRLELSMRNGTFSIDDIDKYIEQQRGAADSLAYAIQKQLDNWREANHP